MAEVNALIAAGPNPGNPWTARFPDGKSWNKKQWCGRIKETVTQYGGPVLRCLGRAHQPEVPLRINPILMDYEMNLFDDIKREPATSMSNRYSAFVALNQDGSPGAQDLRDNLESWFWKFPSDSKDDLRGRFRSDLPDSHGGAFFELFLHELLINLGFTIKAHPALPNSTHKPDFLVCDGSQCFYLEAATTGKRSGPFTSTNLEEEVIEALRTLTSSNFNLLIEMTGNLSESIKKPPLLSKFNELLSQGHDPDEVKATVDADGVDAAPSAQYETDGWGIQAWLSPISRPARRHCQTRRIKVNFKSARRTNSIDPVRNKLKGKGKNYGVPQLPLVIAVKTQDMFYNGRQNDMEVLFGNERILYVDDVPELDREPNGVWSRGHGTRIGAFFSVQRADIRNFRYASGCLYINPSQSGIALPDALLRLPHGNVIQGKMTWSDGVDIGQLLSNG